MAEQTVKQYVLAALLFGVMIAGSFGLISLALPEENEGTFSSYNSTYNKFEAMRADTLAIAKPVEDAEPKTGIGAILDGLIDASWGSLKLVWSSLGTLVSMVNHAASGGLGITIPNWFTGFIVASISITIAFGMMAAWFKWRI